MCGKGYFLEGPDMGGGGGDEGILVEKMTAVSRGEEKIEGLTAIIWLVDEDYGKINAHSQLITKKGVLVK